MDVKTVEIIEVQEDKQKVKATVSGTYSNYSLPTPEEAGPNSNTLWYLYEKTGNGYRIYGIRQP